jgi:hypothetical protein
VADRRDGCQRVDLDEVAHTIEQQRWAEPFSSCGKARLLLGSYPAGDDNTESLAKMKVFLRNRETGQFYTGPSGWSENSSVANNFDTVESATTFAKLERLAGLEVVVRDNSGPDLILPLRQAP